MTPPSPPSRRWRRLLLTLAAALVASFALLVWCIYAVITPSREAAGWKKTFLSASGVPCSTTLQLSAGPGLLAVARLVASQIKEVPPEALAALRSVRSASVGVYELGRDHSIAAGTLEACDARMRRLGWRRTVGVRDGRSTVVVYTPDHPHSGESLDVCLAVLEDDKLVLVSGTIAGRYLLPLISQKFGRRAASSSRVEQI